MSLKIKQGNIFASSAHTIAIPVDYDGDMDYGLALECRIRHPQTYYKFLELRKERKSLSGGIWSLLYLGYRVRCSHVDMDSYGEESLRKALESFVSSYKEIDIYSVAFPLLEIESGLSQQESLSIMEEYLSGLDIPVYIYKDIPGNSVIEYDNLFTEFREFVLSADSGTPFRSVSPGQLQGIKKELWEKDVFLLQHLLNAEGLDLNTLEGFCREVDSYLMIHRW